MMGQGEQRLIYTGIQEYNLTENNATDSFRKLSVTLQLCVLRCSTTLMMLFHNQVCTHVRFKIKEHIIG